MNAKFLSIAAVFSSFAGLPACISERDATDAQVIDTDTDAVPADTDMDTDTTDVPTTSTDADSDGRVDGIGSDEIVPHGDYIDIAKRRLPTTNLDEIYFVGRGLGTDDDYCSTQVIVEELDDEFVRVTVPAYVADNGYLFGNIRRMPNGECVDSGEQSYWGSLDDLYGQDPAICPNPDDEYRKGILVNFNADGEVVNPMDCTAAIGDNDPGNDDEDDDDVAGVPDDEDTDTNSDDDGDGLSNDEEEEAGTNPDDSDSDNDGHTDGDEVDDGTDPLDSEDPDDGGDTDDEDSDSDTDADSGATIAVEVTTDSSWCSGTWELWAWNETSWKGNWPGLSSTEYIATGSSSMLEGSLADSKGGDLVWIQGECLGEGAWIAENVEGTPGEHVSSIVLGGDTYTVSYSTTDDDPSSGTCNKRSSAYDMVCKLN